MPDSDAPFLHSTDGRRPLSLKELKAFIVSDQVEILGLAREDRLCTAIPNGPEAAVCFFAFALRCTFAPLNIGLSRDEFEFEFADLPAKALVVQAKEGLSEEDQKNTGNAVSVARKCKVEKLLELTPSKEVAGLFQLAKHAAGKPLKGDALGNPLSSVKREQLALVLHTSGTTKKPKIVPLTHANIACGAKCIASTARALEHICLNTMPLFHIHGLIVNILASAVAGSQVVCLPGVFQVQNFHGALVAQPEPNWYSAVPTMHLQILQFAEEVAKEKGKPPENKLELVRNCSAALVPTVAVAMEEVLKAADSEVATPLPASRFGSDQATMHIGPNTAWLNFLTSGVSCAHAMATVEGTRRFVERLVRQQRLAPALATRRLGPLHCTALGFGAYRFPGEAKDQVPREILQRALSSVNVIDTSSHYVSGESEREIGKFFSAVDAREEYILCTKVGHVPRGTSPKGAVPIYQRVMESSAQDDLHCIEGSFVESEVRSCLERLKMKQIDFVMLHNPEYLLSARMQEKVPIADAWDEMYGALFEAFKTLERLCDEGIISCGYGVSSNFLSCLFSVTGLPNLYESLVLDRVLDAAQAAAQAENCQSCRFQVAQLPLNAWENGAVLGREAQAEGDCFMATRLGISLLTNRPINALPIPGVSSGDWGRNDKHLQLREAKPMGTTESLLKRVLTEALGEEAPLQQLALRLALSAPGSACTLNGAHRWNYLDDLEEVLTKEPFQVSQVQKAMTAARSMATELGTLAWPAACSFLAEACSLRLGNILLFSSCLRATSAADRWVQAAQLLARVDGLQLRGDGILFNAALQGPWEAALGHLRRLEGANMAQVTSYNTGISLCRGHWCHQRALLKTTQTRSIQADVITYNGLATAEGLPWRKALRGLEDSALQHLKATVVSLNSVLSAMSLASWSLPLQIFRTLKRLNSLKPDVISYTALVSHMAGMADGVARWWMSVRLLQELRQQGLSPNRVSLNSLMATLPWLVALTSVLAIDGPGAANPAADVVSCNTAMDACAKAAQWGRAFELKEQMGLNALKTDVITSSALLTACEGAAVWPTGVRWLSASVVTFCGALSLLARRSVELWRGALQIFSAHKAELLRPNCYAYSAMATGLRMDTILRSSLVNVYQEGHHWKGALDMLEATAPNLVAYCAVMGATSSASRTPRPPHAWRRAVQLYAALQWARVGALSACSTVCGALEAERSARSTSSAELWVELQRRALSVSVMPTYAMTESMPICSNPRYGKRKLRSVGMKAGPDMQIMNGHPDNSFMKVGEEGEVVVKHGPVTSGYEFRDHMDANPNIEAFGDGWLRTGDKGWVDSDGGSDCACAAAG
ncbi:Oxalate--CoA ligase (Oxalyl-CoA synthetase) (Peroxisomal-coenzyme A synthetase) [Durusdinium trenchii]|uniref:Oxalate--CoA ligase (Oxalyl-CoA synthetase) (Peroxisomal-coenzyme A synthetase) n=1 Tax=Durusdinium trenchii TaxID=1381693 RepID=A0ABP0N238_9DINO